MVAEFELPPDISQRIQVPVAGGDHPDAESAICEAVQLLEDHHEYLKMREAIVAADLDVDAGKGIPWNEETRAQLWAESLELVESGEEIDPDAWPK